MNHAHSTHSKSRSINRTVKSKVDDVTEKASGTLKIYEDKIRESPEKAVLIALAAGYCLHVLPVRSLLALSIRLATFLAKPALLGLGAAKLCEFVQTRARLPK